MKFKEKAGVYSVRLALGLLAGSMLTTVYAQEAEKVQRIEITGSNIKRIDKETSSPVQTISSKDIQRSGATSVAELMRTLPVFGGGNVIDLNNKNSFSEGVSTVSLRGFGSTSTLILLNGRRVTPAAIANPNNGQSTTYDVNSIPASMIERIEILKDGASAIYGSDAIAGVVNFITKSNFEGATISSRYSANDKGRFGNKNFSGSYGYGDLVNQGYNFMISVDAKQRDRVKLLDADDKLEQDIYYDLVKRNNPYGSAISNQAFFFKERSKNSATFTTSGAASQVVSGPTAVVVNQTGCSPDRMITGSVAANNLAASSYLVGRPFCNFNTYEYAEAQGDSKNMSVFARGTINLNSNVTAFSELAFNRSESLFTGVPRTISGTAPSTVLKAGGIAGYFQPILPIGHPDNPFKDARAAVNYRFEGSNTDSKNIYDNLRLLAGVKGTAGRFDLESAVLWNRSNHQGISNGMLYFPTAKTLYTENRSLASLAADPTLLRSVKSDDMSEIQQIDVKASTEFGTLPGGAFGLAFGAELRRENMILTPDEVLQRGDIVGLSNIIVNDERRVSSAFIELRAPLLKNLEADFAGRIDKYPGFKTSFVPKAGFKWTTNDQLSFRGTYAEGFRAPSVSQLSTKGVQSFSSIRDILRCDENVSPATPKPGADIADCNKSYSKSSGGSANGLTPETSKSMTFGAIWSPTKSFDVVVDYYKIRREDETATLSANAILKAENVYGQYVKRDQNQATWIADASGKIIPNSGPLLQINTPYYNSGSTETSGIDLELALRNNLGVYGKLSSRLNMQYVLAYKTAEVKGNVETNLVGTRGNYYDWVNSNGTNTPRIKIGASTSWELNDHSVSVNASYIDSVSLMRGTDNGVDYATPFCQFDASLKGANGTNATQTNYMGYFPDCKVASWTTVGASYSYSGFKNWTLSANVQNLFDKKAPYDPDQTTAGYNNSLHNNYGRVLAVSASYKF